MSGRRCVVCGSSLPETSRSDRRTCSAKCRVALSRRMRRTAITVLDRAVAKETG